RPRQKRHQRMAGDRRSLPEIRGSRRLFAARAASLRQGVLAKVDTNRLPWGDHLGEVSGYRARTTPAVDQCHPRMKMRSEKCGVLTGAACKNSPAKLVVYPVGAFAAWSCIGHVSLAWVTRRGQRGKCYHPRRMRAAQIGLIGTLTERLTPPSRALLVVRIAADGGSRRTAAASDATAEVG